MWLEEQRMPQPPQLLALVAMLVSQPSVCLLPLQSAKPEAQAPLQTPLLQVGVMWLVEQTVPQLPQLAGSELMLTSQPSAELPLQFENPTLQVPMLQAPAVQVEVALGAEQTCP
ncbi:MAG: hypothetical protein JWR69_1557, partial [Pedosphaera sp.]|nr:hypothetical protein [Pedosphaera sp.]